MTNQNTTALISRIQAQLRYSASQNFEATAVPPFLCFINPDDDFPGSNYAVPDVSMDSQLAAGVDGVTEVYRQHQRIPRFEFLEEFIPELPGILEARGFELEMRALLMTCVRVTFIRPPAVEGLTLLELSQDAPVKQVQAFMMVQRRSFGMDASPAVTAADAASFRERFSGVRLFAAALNGKIVGVGSLLQPLDRVAEVAGIATLQDYRRRGIASALTAWITAAGFEDGLECVFLSAGDAAAGRVYTRVGFVFAGHALAYAASKNGKD